MWPGNAASPTQLKRGTSGRGLIVPVIERQRMCHTLYGGYEFDGWLVNFATGRRALRCYAFQILILNLAYEGN